MKRLLKLKEKEKLQNTFKTHPLLLTCFKVFTPCRARLNGLEVTEYEIFYESACLLDYLLYTHNINQNKVNSLWTNLLLDIRNWKPDATEYDKQVVAGTIFHIVRATLAQYYDTYYSESVCNLLIQRLKVELEECNYSKFAKYHLQVLEQSEALCEWINEYEEADKWLSEQIANVISPRKKINKDGFQPSGTTFTKTALLTDKLIDIIGQRLVQANKLKASPDDWRKLFSGINQQFDLIWLGKEGELRDLFKMLTDTPQYATPNRNYQLILKSHFLDKNGNRFDNLHGAKSIKSFQPILDDCIFLLQHFIDSMTDIMKNLVLENEDALHEIGYFDKLHASKQAGLTIRNKHR